MREDRPICPAVVPDERRVSVLGLLARIGFVVVFGGVALLNVFGAMLALIVVFQVLTGALPW